MRFMPRRSWRPILLLLGLLFLSYAAWGMYRAYPDFTTLRAEPATIKLPAPATTATP